MAIFEDDFQAYTAGTTLPFGSWAGTGASIVGSGGPYPSNGKYVNIFNGGMEYVSVSSQTSISVFFAFRVLLGTKRNLLELRNGPNGSSQTFTLFNFQIEADGTLTAKVPLSNQFLVNSYDHIVRNGDWNFAQVNVTFSDVVIGGTTFVHIVVHVAVNGVEVLVKSADTTIGVTQLKNGTADVNRFVLTSEGADYDNFTLDTLQTIVTYPHPGSPFAIVPHAVDELSILPDSAQVRIEHGVIEFARLPNSAQMRAIQGVIELLILQDVSEGLWKVEEI
jgi:hypothetical protein